jgi:hypothetical protein
MDNKKLVELNHQILDKNEEILNRYYELTKQLDQANEIMVELDNNGYYPSIRDYLKKFKLWRKS